MQNGVKDTLKENSVAKNTQADKVEQTVKDAQKAAGYAVVSETAGINKINNSDLNKDAVVSDAGKLGKAADEKQAETVNFNLDDAALQGLSKEGSANLAKLFNTSLAVANEGTENQNINTNPKNESKPVTTWDAVRQAAGAGDKSVKIKGNITASDNLNVIGNLTIEGVDGATLSLGQNSIVNNGNLTPDITKDKLDDIKNYALSHTSDQTLEYIKHNQAVSQDSGWKMTDAAGNPVTDPYAAVESPKLDGYTATIKSTNAPGVTQGADGSEVQAKLKINPDAVVKDGELTDAYKNNGVTGIPENYETVVVYKKEAEKGSVTVKYIDDTADKTLETKDLSGEVGEKSDYSTAPTIEDYTDKGYKLVSDDYPKSGVTFTKEPQKYEVHLKHTYSPVTPDDHHDVDPNEVTKNVKETVHYTGAGDKTPNDNVQNATWTRHLTKDNVTGKLVPNGKYDTPWTPSETDYKAVPSPKVDDYTPDKETVPSTPLTMDDINVTVTYTKNETPVVPPDSPNPIAAPTPTPQPEPKKPETPKTPEKDKTPEPDVPEPDEPEPDEPDEPDVPTPRRHHKNKKHTPAPKPANNWSNNYAPHGQNGYYNNFGSHGQGTPGPNGGTIMPNGEVLDRNGNVVGYIDANGKIHYTLPQTGENQSEGVAAAALGGAVVAIGLVSLVGVKKRHTN